MSSLMLPTINALTEQFRFCIQSVSIVRNKFKKKVKMVSIKVQTIIGFLVLCVYSEFYAEGIRFRLPRPRPRGSGLSMRMRPKMSQTQIKRTNTMGSQSSISRTSGSLESIAPPAAAVEKSKKSQIGAVIATEVGKSLALGGTLVAANSFSSYTDSKIRQSVDAETQDLNQQRQQQQNRATIDCKTNEYGCFKGMCWTNCGPRLDKGDWCFATKNKTVDPKKIANCSIDTDCNSCWSCARDCTENIQ